VSYGKLLLWSLGGLALLAGITWGLLLLWGDLLAPFLDPRNLRETLTGAGPLLAPLAFIGIQAFQVIAAPIPGEATGILGGYLFGPTWGTIYSTIGLSVGSWIAYGLARSLGTPVVRRWVPPAYYDRLHFLTRPQATFGVFLLFVIPGFPKDYLCYLLGVSPMPFGTFAVVASLGRLPATYLLTLQGAKFAGSAYGELAVLLMIGGLLVLGCFIFRGQILAILRARQAEFLKRHNPHHPDE
jgi:uncharacterized membrane protein YdjX (TVP38/TMEM64 family)